MSEFTVTVTPSETFPDNTNVTRAMLRNAATPQVSLSGTIGTSDISNGAITDAKVSATAAINGTKLGITRGAILTGGVNDAGVILHPDTSATGAFSAGGYDGVSNNKRARFAVSRGTNPNEMGLIGTDIGTVGGDIKIDVVDNRLKVDIQNGKVDAKHISSTIGGQSLTPSGNAYNDNPTIGITGSDDDAYLRVLDNSINAAQLANATNSEYYGGLFAFTSDGSCAQIKGGDVGQVLTGKGNSNPEFQTLYKDLNLGQPPTGASKFIRIKHGLASTPTDLKLYLKCTASSGDTNAYNQNDIIMVSASEQDDENAYTIFSDSTHFCYNQHSTIFVKPRPYTTSAAANDQTSPVSGTSAVTWSAITPSNWELHALVR